MKTITYEMKNPIKYASGNGDEIEGQFIEISEPTGKIAHLVMILKSEMGSATKESLKGMDLSNIPEGNDSDQTPEQVGESAFMMLTMGGADMERVTVTFKEILKVSALMAGEKSFTSTMFDRMSFADVEESLKAYIGNFIQA